MSPRLAGAGSGLPAFPAPLAAGVPGGQGRPAGPSRRTTTRGADDRQDQRGVAAEGGRTGKLTVGAAGRAEAWRIKDMD